MQTSGHNTGAPPERPSNSLVFAIVMLVILLPLCLLLGTSSLYTAWKLLEGPQYRSETPVWMGAFFQLLRAIVALLGVFVPIKGMIQALKVNSEYDAGNYAGAEAASKSAASQCRQSVIFLVLIFLIMAVDLLTFFATN